jgi:hypothetical protein
VGGELGEKALAVHGDGGKVCGCWRWFAVVGGGWSEDGGWGE